MTPDAPTHTCGRVRRGGRRCPRHAPHLLAHLVNTGRGQFAGWQKWRACGRHARRARRNGAVRIPPGIPPSEFLAKLQAPPEAPPVNPPEPRERRR